MVEKGVVRGGAEEKSGGGNQGGPTGTLVKVRGRRLREIVHAEYGAQ